MAKQIYEKGAKLGGPNGCVVCHGGNPAEEKEAKLAHIGAPEGGSLDTFVLHSASVWVNEKICGQCHEPWVYAQYRSIMQTEAGKIQGALWGWGPAATGYEKKYGNSDVDDPDGPEPVFGTRTYKEYTQALMKAYPNNFPSKLVQVPKTSLALLKENPYEAIYTYIRTDCQRCLVGVKGRDKRGDFCGMGCAACHVPYNTAGKYEGGDKTVKPDETGHAMVHSIQSTRKTKVVVNNLVYSGIPHETCVSCHNRDKSIGVSFQGLMEFPYGSPFAADGGKQPQLHTKFYPFIKDDVHHQLKSREGNSEGGLLCQDCHSSTAMHGNGNITGTLLANVEIECYGCHVKVDFSGGKSATDWVAAGNTHFPDGHTAESMRGVEPATTSSFKPSDITGPWTVPCPKICGIIWNGWGCASPATETFRRDGSSIGSIIFADVRKN